MTEISIFARLSVHVLDETIPIVSSLSGIQGDLQEASPARHRHLQLEPRKQSRESHAETNIIQTWELKSRVGIIK